MDATARTAVFAPLQVEGAVEAIVRRIGEAIGSGVLEPGERLPSEGELAAPPRSRADDAAAGARDPPRRRLRGDPARPRRRLVRGAGRPSRAAAGGDGATSEQLRELTDWRCAISGETAALAALRADGASGRAAAGGGRGRGRRGVVRGLPAADARFHVAVAEASRNARLVRAETAIQAEIGEVLRFVPGPELARRASGAGHGPVLDAVGRRRSGSRAGRHGAARRGDLRLDRRSPARPGLS